MAPRSRHSPEQGSQPPKFSTGFRCYPTNRDIKGKSPLTWLEGKRVDDNTGPYWRIQDKLYDLNKFIDKHPGGKDWILMTKGTDITEAFETSHISTLPEKMLSKYYVRDASKPRVSPYTFRDDGFYRTLKRKVRPILEKVGRGPDWKMVFIQDGLLATFLALAVTAVLMESSIVAAAAGVALAMVTICAHNFFHQRDNWRMYYFDLSLLSSYDWRITHGLSHHLFPNSIYDYEISILEPFLEFLPKKNKNFVQRHLSPFYSLFFYSVIMFLQITRNLIRIIRGNMAGPENLLPFVEMACFCVFSNTVMAGFKLWLVVQCSFTIWFSFVGLTAAHHHPNIYHEGDAMRKDPDWGLCQLDAVRDRVEVTGNLFLVCTTFGDHSLHHLFPTVDHSKLHYLYPAFYETCKEFKYPFKLVSQWELVRGKYMQMANVTPNTIPPDSKNRK